MYLWLLPIWAPVTKKAHTRCFGKPASYSGISDERWRLFIFFWPRWCGSACAAARPSQGQAFNCFFAGGLILTMSSLASATDRNHRKQQQKGFQPTLPLPCRVCQTKEDPLIWSQQEPSSVGSSAAIFWQEKLARRPRSRMNRPTSWTSSLCIFSAFLRTLSIIFQANETASDQKVRFDCLWCRISAPHWENRICVVASGTSPWELAHRKLFPITRIPQVKRGLRSLGKKKVGNSAGWCRGCRLVALMQQWKSSCQISHGPC